MRKKYQWIALSYIFLVILVPPLLGWTVVSWRDASFMEFARRFSNLIPLRGIWEIVTRGTGTWQLAQLKLYGLHLLVMIPLGLLVGFMESHRGLRYALMKYLAAIVMVYGIRLVLKLGSFDMDDILMDLLGLTIGWLVASLLNQKPTAESGSNVE